ncbi:hypothetical protein OROMI_002502 [Orobanche minor]
MEPKIYMLDSITPDTKNWTAKVSIVNKTEPRTSSQPASIRFQKMLLADTKNINKPFIITFWNDTAPDDVYNLLDHVKDRHIIAALNFNVTEYHSNWYFIHRRENDDIQNQGDVFGIAQSTFSIDPETFTSIQTFLKAEQDRSFLCVRGKLLSQIQNLIYPCCTKCHRLTTAKYNCPFECHSCHETKTAIPRYRLSILIYDQTGEMEVTAFGDEGEKIMQMSAADFLDKSCNARLPTLDSINSNLQQLQLKMKVHSKVFNKQDGTSILSHTIQSMECHQLPSSTINTDEIPAALPPEYQICCSLITIAGRGLRTAAGRRKTSHIINGRPSSP